MHTSFLRTVAPYSDQARVWVNLVRMFDWKRVVIMHSSDEEGRGMLGKLQNQAETKGIGVSRIFVFFFDCIMVSVVEECTCIGRSLVH